MPLEDVVTSTIFGPLSFMSPDERGSALRALCKGLNLELECEWKSAELLFWPKRPVAAMFRANFVEPDLVLADARGIVALIEIKWGAPLSELELAAQWSSLTAEERRRVSHILLVQNPLSYQKAIAVDRIALQREGLLPWKLDVLSWRDTGKSFENLTSEHYLPPHVRRWARAAAELLHIEHGVALVGWSHAGLRQTAAAGWKFRQEWFASLSDVEAKASWWGVADG